MAALRVSDGQLREIEWSGCFERTPAEYVRVATRKTASLFELAAFFGGYVAEMPVAERSALARFGHHLGIAFQLFDDLDDFDTSAEEHRPPANDLRERIYTLPVLFGCASEGALGTRLRELLREDGRPLGEKFLSEICGLLESSGAFEAALRSAEAQRDLAATCLDELQPTSVRRMLTHLLDSLSPRPHHVYPIATGVAQ